ncbi:hypothetical protein CHUAL_000370 [Chamberlinius hualienensis]
MYRGLRYVDGCYSDNLPVLDKETITVAPFSGESDICPKDNSYNLLLMNLANTSIELSVKNLYRFTRVLFPPHPNVLSEICHQGFQDATKFLIRRGLINCSHCEAGNTTIKPPNNYIQAEGRQLCYHCLVTRRVVQMDGLPEAIFNVLQEACVTMNKGFINWVLQHKVVQAVKGLKVSYVLPWNLAYIFLSTLYETVPKLRNDVLKIVNSLIEYVKNVLRKIQNTSGLRLAKLQYHLSMVEYQYDSEDTAFQYTQIVPLNEILRQPCEKPVGHFNVDVTLDIESNNPEKNCPEIPCHNLLNPVCDAGEYESSAVQLANFVQAFNSIKADPDSQSSHDDVVELMRTRDNMLICYYRAHDQIKMTDIYDIENGACETGVNDSVLLEENQLRSSVLPEKEAEAIDSNMIIKNTEPNMTTILSY